MWSSERMIYFKHKCNLVLGCHYVIARLAISCFLLFASAFSSQIHAQGVKRLLHRADSVLSYRYFHSDIDTNYIIRPTTKWTVLCRFNLSGSTIRTEGFSTAHFTSEVKATNKGTASMGLGYMGLMASVALNPAQLWGKYRDYEYNLNSYSNRTGFDIIYQDAHNYSGWHERENSERFEFPNDVLTMKTLNVNGYYAFNYRKFSYPAAFSQSYIQKRSAGSLLLAASFQGQKGTAEHVMKSKIKTFNIGIGAGYGYNWVPARNWLFHISALPTFIVYNHASITTDGDRKPIRYKFPEVIITGRGAIVHQMKRFFAGASMVFNFTSIGDKDDAMLQNIKWRNRMFVGYRF